MNFEKQSTEGKKPELAPILSMRRKLKELLKPERYEHSLSVSFCSIALAMRYGFDIEKAEIAGLCHDCAKHFGKEELLRECRRAGISLSPELRENPQVLHSIYGPCYVRELFGITDEEILSAIRSHTLGRPGMGLLEKIVFTADYIEARRWRAARLPELRRLAFVDLNRAVYEILRDTVEYIRESGAEPCTDSLASYHYYRALLEGTAAEEGEKDERF